MNEYINTVNELNCELFEIDENLSDKFYYTTTGNIDVVGFGNTVLWCSEDDNRIFDENTNNYEPFTPFIKRLFNQFIDVLQKCRFSINE